MPGSYSGNHEDYQLLGCDAMWPGRITATFRNQPNLPMEVTHFPPSVNFLPHYSYMLQLLRKRQFLLDTIGFTTFVYGTAS